MEGPLLAVAYVEPLHEQVWPVLLAEVVAAGDGGGGTVVVVV